MYLTKSRYALRFPNWGKPTTKTMSSPHSTLVTKNISAMETRRPGTNSRRLGTRRAKEKRYTRLARNDTKIACPCQSRSHCAYHTCTMQWDAVCVSVTALNGTLYEVPCE